MNKIIQTNPSLSVTIAGAQDMMLAELFKRKTRIEASTVINVFDDQEREMEVFYRVIDTCPNPQTDKSADFFTIEQVLYLNRRVRLTGRGEQNLLEWLYLNNNQNLRA